MNEYKMKIIALICEYKKYCDQEGFGEDDMETWLLEMISEAGIEFSR